MTPLLVTLAILYFLPALVCCRMMCGHLAWILLRQYKNEYPLLGEKVFEPKPEMWLGGLIGGCALAVIWPLVLLFVRWPVKMGAELEADRARRAEYIKRLERDAGIG